MHRTVRVLLRQVRVLPMTFHERRWTEAQGKKKRTTTERSPMIPTERLVVAASTKADAFHFDRMCEWWKRLKPPRRVQR